MVSKQSKRAIEPDGYRIVEELYNGVRTLVHRGIRQADGRSVILKWLKNPSPAFAELVRFRNQYVITHNLDLPGIVKPLALEPYRNGYILVMPDEGYVSLQPSAISHQHLTARESGKIYAKQDGQRGNQSSLNSHPLSIADFLNIGIQLTDILHGLYQNRVIHKDIKPANILIHPETKQVKLIDFSIASLLPKEAQEIQNPNLLEGTLAYISPEQTGRTNRGLDYRTDFYSLGVTFYELLAGELPFNSEDPMELVHSHIAKSPVFPRTPHPIPPTLSEIALKLMAKNAEDRYQSALGLKRDLEKCLSRWQESGAIEPFELGERDACDRFLIPEKLYGREAEVAQLLTAFERVSQENSEFKIQNSKLKQEFKGQDTSNSPQPPNSLTPQLPNSPPPQFPNSPTPHSPTPHTPHPTRSELVLVAGYSGVGKTAVINEVRKPIIEARGYFIQGKFDQFNRNIPFCAFVQAFQDLIQQLLCESEPQLQQWRDKILQALGKNGQVMIDAIPSLEQIIGPQPPVPELSGSADQNRFNFLLQNFIQVFTTQDHPLVIFLDDLQWADVASLHLLTFLLYESKRSALLVIGAYRDNEVSLAHPLNFALEKICQAQARVSTIAIAPLPQEEINRLIADTLRCSPDLASPLTQLIYRKTQGNPFFTTQFLRSLQSESFITFNECEGYWQCDLARIQSLTLSDNAVELMVRQLQKLAQETQNILKIAACIGNQFELQDLAIIAEQTSVEIVTSLWPALQAGLIRPQSQIYLFGRQEQEFLKTEKNILRVSYKFLHDRVQQAAYSLIPEAKKQSTHLKIGQLLLRNTPTEKQDEKIFAIVNQLNLGVDLIAERSQRDELAKLNLRAGQKAKASTAYSAALQYFSVGIELLPKTSWSTSYNLTLTLYVSATEAAYLSGHFTEMERLAEIVLKQGKSILDVIAIYEIKILTCMAQNQPQNGVEIALKTLKDLGIELPENPTQDEIGKELQATAIHFNERAIEAAISLPEMTAPTQLAAVRILATVFPLTYILGSNLMPLAILKIVNLSRVYGNTAPSSLGYVGYGLILCSVVGEIETGYQFGTLALKLLDRINAPPLKVKIVCLFNLFVRHFKEHNRMTLQPLLEAYQSAVEVGDWEYAAYSAHHYDEHCFFAGVELSELAQKTTSFSKELANLKQETIFRYNEMLRQVVLNLSGQGNQKPWILQGEAYDEVAMEPLHQQANDGLALFYLNFKKFLLLYWFSHFSKALEKANLTQQYLSSALGMLDVPAYYFYDSLVRLAIYPQTDESSRQEILTAVAANQAKIQHWARHAPMNYQHKYELVEAERDRVLGNKLDAMDRYDRAIAGAQENEYLQEEALANELAAKFYLDWGKEKIARTYLTDAYSAYSRWGGKAKVEDLERLYPQYIEPLQSGGGSSLEAAQLATQTLVGLEPSTLLDLSAFVKAAGAIAGEMQRDRLLSTLMQISIENAGAETGALILYRKGTWRIEARANNRRSEGIEAESLPAIPLGSCQDLPLSIIRSVMRTQEPIVLANASRTDSFAADPYILDRQPKSLLCLPILAASPNPRRHRLLGLLYLENNLVSGAFASARVEFLNLLIAQAAIALENSQLYTQVEAYSQVLEIQVEERTQSLEQFSASLKQIHRLNTTDYQSFEDLFEDYLQTGCQILEMPIGTICRLEGTTHIVYAVESEIPEIFPGLAFELENGYCASVHRDRQTVAYDRVGEIDELQDNLLYQQLHIESYLGTPIFVGGEIYGTLNFGSTEVRERGFNDREREIIELIAQGLSKFIAAHQTEMRRQQAIFKMQQRTTQLRHQNSTLLQLAKNPALNEGNLPAAAQAIAQVASASLAERASIWLLSDDSTKLQCLNLFEQSQNQHTQGLELAAADYPAYFQALFTEDIIAASDAHHDSRTCELSESYLMPLGIASMLDVPIHLHGRTCGVLCMAQVGQVYRWTPEDETFARSLADLFSLALEARDRAESQALLHRQNALLQAQQAASIDGILITDEHHQISSYNRRFCELWQVPDELITCDRSSELLNHTLSQIEDPETLLAKIENLYTTDPLAIERFEIRLKDGRVFDHYSSPIQDDNHSYYGRIWYLRDITELVTTQIKLQRQLFALGSTTNGIALLNAEGQYIYLNEAHVRMFGYEHSDELLGKNWQIFYDTDELTRIERDIFPLLMQEGRWQGEAIARRKDGSTFDEELSLSFTEDGILVCICQDISDRKRQEKWLRLMVEGTAASTGEDFFHSCARSLAEVFQVRYVSIAEFVGDRKDRSRTLAFWTGEDFSPNIEYDLAGTPCETVVEVKGGICRYERSVRQQFPQDLYLVDLGVESYVAALIQDTQGNSIGHIAILDTQPIESNLDAQESILKIFAARVGAEMERQKAEDAIAQQMQRVLLLKQMIQDIRESLDAEQIFNTAATLLGTALQVSCCLIHGYETDPEPRLPVVTRYLAPNYQPEADLLEAPVTGNPHAQKVLAQNQAVVSPDVYADPLLEAARPLCEHLGLKSMLAIRTSYQGEINGAIALHQCDRFRQWTLDEISLLEAVAAQVGIALAQAQLLEQEQQQRQELSQKNQALADAKQTLESQNDRLKSALKKLKQTQAQLVQTEKMSGLGQMVAGVAHEINNPVSFIAGNVEHAQTYFQDLLAIIQAYQQEYPDCPSQLQDLIDELDLDFLQNDLQKLLHSMRVGSDRIRNIVLSLRNFSRLDEEGMKPIDLHEGIDNTLLILQHRLKDTGRQAAIEIVKEYGLLPPVTCYASQLNQVFMNILNNAIDALEEQRDRQKDKNQNPQIRICTEVLEGDRALIRIADSGPGMPEKVRQRLFEPFFTTKPIGKGTGLGLSISYQIVVEEHQGQLICTSTPGEGTEFAILLPLSQTDNSG